MGLLRKLIFSDKKLTRFSGHPVGRSLGAIFAVQGLFAVLMVWDLIRMVTASAWVWFGAGLIGLFVLRSLDAATGRSEIGRTQILKFGVPLVLVALGVYVLAVPERLWDREALIAEMSACDGLASRSWVEIGRQVQASVPAAGRMAAGVNGLCRAAALRRTMQQDRLRVCLAGESDSDCLAEVAIQAGRRHGWQAQTLAGMTLAISSLFNERALQSETVNTQAKVDTARALARIAESVQSDPTFQADLSDMVRAMGELGVKRLDQAALKSSGQARSPAELVWDVAALRQRLEALQRRPAGTH